MKSSHPAARALSAIVSLIALIIGLFFFATALAATPAPKTRPHASKTPGPIPLPSQPRIPIYKPGPEPFRDGETLVYDATWAGISAAQARITLSRNRNHPGWWTGQMWINTSKPADLLYRMRDYFREDFDYASWQPLQLQILQHEKTRQDRWTAGFDRHAQLVTAVKTNKAGRKWVRRFSGGAPWGPFSGAMMALSQPLTPGETYVYDVFSGGNRYIFSFKVLGRERITTVLGTFNTLKIEPAVLWLSENSFRDQASGMTIWVTDDPRHLPIRIESAVFIGTVRADLTQLIDAPPAPHQLTTTTAAASSSNSKDPAIVSRAPSRSPTPKAN